MQMKKILGGVLAATLALSALATSAFAAEKERYELHKYQWVASYADTSESFQNGTATPTAGDIIFTFGEDNIYSVQAEVDIANTTNDDVRVAKVAFKQDEKDGKIFKVDVKTTGGLVTGNELNFNTNEYIKSVSLTIKADKMDVDGKDDTTLPITIAVTGSATNVDAFSAYETLTELKSTPVQEKQFLLLNETDVTTLSHTNGTGKIDKAFVQHANNFFTDAKNGQIILEFAPNSKDSDDSQLDPSLPDQDLSLGDTSAVAKDFGLALNWENTNALVQATNIVDNKVIFDWNTLVDAMGGNFTGNIFSMSYKFSKIPSGLNGYDLVAIEYVKDEKGGATTAPDEDDDDDKTPPTTDDKDDTYVPETGTTPVALAVIPVAIAAAFVIAKRKNK